MSRSLQPHFQPTVFQEFQTPKGEWYKPSILSLKVVGANLPSVLFLSVSEPLVQWGGGEEGPYSFHIILREGKNAV